MRKMKNRQRRGLALQLTLISQEPDTGDAVSDADRLWFIENPARSHRMRPAIADELPGLTVERARRAWIIIRQIQPGFRFRLACWPDAPPLDTEAMAHAMFDLLLETMRDGSSRVSPEQVDARVAAMTAGGRA
jgi:hypothetical protein